ncbi:MAG: sigma-70 family RNA polymerase sigma factor [Planctomycetes bacterium]|nr:sigma-70 family RNA polymerase sigma factor [Planctomycetota bacterium]
MNDGDLHDCITQAISTAYDKVREDGSLANLDKWIILVANRRAIDAYRRAASRPALQDPEILSTYRDHRDPSRHQLYRRAIEVARALVRRMKLNNVRRAMEIHIDAVDRGEEVSHREVGEALGVPRDTAKMLRSRGLQRLTKMAEDDGLIQEEFGKSLRELMSLENDDHDDHDDAEENE